MPSRNGKGRYVALDEIGQFGRAFLSLIEMKNSMVDEWTFGAHFTATTCSDKQIRTFNLFAFLHFGPKIALLMEDGHDCQGMNTLEDFLNLLKCIPFTKQVL